MGQNLCGQDHLVWAARRGDGAGEHLPGLQEGSWQRTWDHVPPPASLGCFRVGFTSPESIVLRLSRKGEGCGPEVK